MRPLIARRGRVPALTLIVAGAVVFLALAVVAWHATTTSFDTWAARRALAHFGVVSSPQRAWWLVFSLPQVSLLVPVGVGIWALVRRQWRVLALTAIGPALALGFTEVAKPTIGRVIGPLILQGSTYGSVTGSFPSGHETGTVGWLVVVVVLVLRRTPDRRVRAAVVVAAALWAAAGAFGLTINFYHYATDTIGAAASTTAIVLGVALVIDAVTASRVRDQGDVAPQAGATSPRSVS